MFLAQILPHLLLLAPFLPCIQEFQVPLLAQTSLPPTKQGLDGPPPLLMHLCPVVHGLGPPLAHAGGHGCTLALTEGLQNYTSPLHCQDNYKNTDNPIWTLQYSCNTTPLVTSDVQSQYSTIQDN